MRKTQMAPTRLKASTADLFDFEKKRTRMDVNSGLIGRYRYHGGWRARAAIRRLT